MTSGPKPLWVSGWLTQLFLLALSAAAIWIGKTELSAIFVTGSTVIGVVRQIERDRRA